MNSANADEWAEVTAALAADEVDLLLVSPERLNNPRFRDEQLPRLAEATGLLVVDEAHCISDWGHDFRPDYRRIRDLLADLPAGRPVLATTATANARVVADVVEQLGAGGAPVRTVRGTLARDSLRLGVLSLPTADARLGWLAARLGELPGSGIVYALTVSAAEDTAALLREAGHEVRAYTGRTDPGDRLELERALRDNQVKALVATSALGMGFDKPDLGFVVHLGAPASPVAYYQQVGRAGRATERADVLLLPGVRGPRDLALLRDRVDAAPGATPTPCSPRWPSRPSPCRRPRWRPSPTSGAPGSSCCSRCSTSRAPCAGSAAAGSSTGAGWTYDEQRYARVAAARDAEAALDARLHRHRRLPDARSCRRRWTTPAPPTAVAATGAPGPGTTPRSPTARSRRPPARCARSACRSSPASQWPSGMSRLGVPRSGRISADEQVEQGRVVARLTDLGWGQRLRQLLAEQAPDAPADDRLLAACVEVLAGWGWEQRPVAVVAMPSLRRPQLVASVASHLARLGRLEDLGALTLTTQEPTGGPGGNSAFRLAAVHDRFAVDPDLAARLAGLAGPVLLVDDLVDSRWTVTVAGALLRSAGAPRVLPFALAAAA